MEVMSESCHGDGQRARLHFDNPDEVSLNTFL